MSTPEDTNQASRRSRNERISISSRRNVSVGSLLAATWWSISCCAAGHHNLTRSCLRSSGRSARKSRTSDAPWSPQPTRRPTQGDLDALLAEHAADRSDPETVPVLGDELADRIGQRWLRGSLSRTKKDVAALRISMVCSNSALRRLSDRISAAAPLETPSPLPSST
jgi:hypothetical protein